MADATMQDLFGSDSDAEGAPGEQPEPSGDRDRALEEPQEQDTGPSGQQQPDDVMRGLFGSESEEEGAAGGGDGGGGEAGEEGQAAADDDEEGQAAVREEEEEEQAGQAPSEQEQAAGTRGTIRDIFGSDDEDSGRRSPSLARAPPLAVAVPLHDVLPPRDLRLAKLSNIVRIEQAPFSPDTYELEEAEYVDEAGTRRVQLANRIRWRYAPAGPGGAPTRQSNARFVRWSDGSLQLLVGDEALDVREIDVAGDHNYVYARVPGLLQARGARGTGGGGRGEGRRSGGPQEAEGGAQARGGGRGQGQLSTKFVFQPASLTSGLHKRLTAAVDRQHTRQQKVRATTTLVDPKKVKEQQEKAEEERIRGVEKLRGLQAKKMRQFGVAPRRAQLSSAFLEEEEEELGEEEGEGEEGEREAGRGRGLARPRFGDEAAEAEAQRRLATAKAEAPPPPARKRGRAIGSSEEEGEEEEEDEEEAARREEMRGFIVDDEREEEEARAGAKKRRRVVMESDSE
eukprot:scaffold1.g5619.t1